MKNIIKEKNKKVIFEVPEKYLVDRQITMFWIIQDFLSRTKPEDRPAFVGYIASKFKALKKDYPL